MIRVSLPFHLRNLAHVQGEVELEVAPPITQRRVLDALETCSPTARTIFRLVYATPGGDCAKAAREVGLSLQRVRQILCETRSHIRNAMKEGTP